VTKGNAFLNQNRFKSSKTVKRQKATSDRAPNRRRVSGAEKDDHLKSKWQRRKETKSC
jgi:hypothetical protein